VRIIINDQKKNPLAIHNKKNVDPKGNSSQNRCRTLPTESHIYTGDEHHDETTWVITKTSQSGEQIKPHKKKE
jgi:hypothetical protein